MNPEQMAREIVVRWRRHSRMVPVSQHFTLDADLVERIATALHQAQQAERDVCLDWIRAFQRDCGCAERIETALRQRWGAG